MTRDRYQTRLAKFFDFIDLRGTKLEDRTRSFAERGKGDSNWAFNNILKFVQFQNDGINKKAPLHNNIDFSELLKSFYERTEQEQ